MQFLPSGNAWRYLRIALVSRRADTARYLLEFQLGDTNLTAHQAVRYPTRRRGEALSIWQRERVLDPRSGIARLPVRELSLTQSGPGSGAVDATIAASEDVTLLRARLTSPCIGATILHRAYTTFSTAVPIVGTVQINGETARSTTIYTPVDGEGMYMSGGARDVTSVMVRRDSFGNMVASLCGIDPEDVALDGRKFELSPPTAGWLRQHLDWLVAEHTAPSGSAAAHRFTDEVFSLLAEVYLTTGPSEGRIPNFVRQATRIVRKAEERFAAAGEQSVSLADLCKAAGVSARSLYRAFDVALGVPPLEYFRKRRLVDARLRLLGAAPSRGSVKRAALSAGLTELGRFSAEYRQLFGESPSATLNARR